MAGKAACRGHSEGVFSDGKLHCACPQPQVDLGNGLPVSVVPKPTHDTLASRMSIRPKPAIRKRQRS
ncbi:hypothetical protein NECAME_10253 [Necator americanus]|uniref:Uncharacterized protein n=1 Tax=Necator americanus TaxID=51031 RepID=W2TC54_NECAM|nr:hypothetical protein NECAME_10253 [Necator americanus]ETN78592.1 hypothetical protein NECAME_10253 [Necator americanus]